MSNTKTRCNQCINKDKKSTQIPCCDCEEIQFSHNSDKNYFESKEDKHGRKT